MLPVQRWRWDSAEYAEAFATLVRCCGGRVDEHQILRELVAAYPAESHAVDWGAGAGEFTSLLIDRFDHVYAVEPHPGMRSVLATRCAKAQVMDGTIMSTVLPTKVDVGLISHVFYHVPDHKWGAYTIHAAQQLTENGLLVVSLKAADSACNQMLEAFGAPCYDLHGGLARVMRLHPEFTFSFRRAAASIRTTSFADTLTIARFMLCDRDAEAFSRPPTEKEFQAYVREHFWDERQGRGGWECANMFCCVRRHAVDASDGRGRNHLRETIMPDVWTAVQDSDQATQDRLADVLEKRGGDAQQQAMRHAFLQEVPFPRDARVLDVGCGTGVLTRVLARWPNVASVVGVDPARVLLERARVAAADLPEVSFREGDGRSLPFDSAMFDIVTFDSMLSHVPGPERAIGEAFRVLRARGCLAVFDGDYATTTVALADHDPLQVCVDAMMANSVTDRRIMRRLTHVVAACGFEVVSFRSFGFAEIGNDGYMLTVVDRGADILCSQGHIGTDTAAALKEEARRRLRAGRFFGHIAYAGLIARKP